MNEFAAALINGITLGAIYALIAVGYTMVYGIIKLINFAHGEVFMLGTFVALVVLNSWGLGLISAIVVAMVACMVLGGLIDWVAYLPLRRSHRVPDLLSTAGIIVIPLLSIAYFLAWKRQAADSAQGIIALILLLAAPAILFGVAVAERLNKLGPPRRMFEADRLSALITAIGMSLTLQYLAVMVWGPDYEPFPGSAVPAWFNEKFLGVQGKEFVIWLAALGLMVGLHWLVTRTRIGKAMRASSMDKQTAALMGIDVNRVIMITFMIGSAMAAVASILYAAKVGGNISYRMGYYPGLIAFAAAVLGGIGNIQGAMLGGLILGVTQGFCIFYVSAAYDFAFAFGVMILVILVRPWGILGRREAARA